MTGDHRDFLERYGEIVKRLVAHQGRIPAWRSDLDLGDLEGEVLGELAQSAATRERLVAVPEGSREAYLAGIVRNVCANVIHRRGRRPVLPGGETMGAVDLAEVAPVARGPGPKTAVELADLVSWCRRSLTGDPHFLEIFDLLAAGRNPGSAAALLGIDAGVVRRRKAELIRKLRTILGVEIPVEAEPAP